MALCPRCRTSECTLETVGVFACPVCGRVNADGEIVPDGATEVAHFATRAGDSSFAAPPPVSAPARGSNAAIPRAVLVYIVVQALLTAAYAAAMGIDAIGAITCRVVVLGGLLIGDRDSYRIACFGSLVVVVTDLYRLSTYGSALVVIALVIDLASIGVLLSPATRRHYEKPVP